MPIVCNLDSLVNNMMILIITTKLDNITEAMPNIFHLCDMLSGILKNTQIDMTRTHSIWYLHITFTITGVI